MFRWSGLRRLRAGPSPLASSVAVGATAFLSRRGGRSCRLASRGGDCPRWSFAPHWTRRSVPALGVYGIDEDSSLPRSGIARRRFSDLWRVEQTPGAPRAETRYRGQPERNRWQTSTLKHLRPSWHLGRRPSRSPKWPGPRSDVSLPTMPWIPLPQIYCSSSGLLTPGSGISSPVDTTTPFVAWHPLSLSWRIAWLMRLGRTMDQTAFENRRFHISSWMYDSRRRACLRRPPAYRPQCWWGLCPGESPCPGEMPGWCVRTCSTKI
jgi:hypothetical protein